MLHTNQQEAVELDEVGEQSSPLTQPAVDRLGHANVTRDAMASAERPKKPRRNPVWNYFYGMCCLDDEISGDAAEDAAALRHSHSDSSAISDAPPSPYKESRLMQFLKREAWTDGSLIALKTDIFAGITLAVTQVAPSVAFALMAHCPPLSGLFSSFFLGLICCVFGGRPGQVTAIAGAVVALYPQFVDKHSPNAAYAVCLIGGCLILLPGIFKVARLVRLLPSSLMVGFCNGLAFSMVVRQIDSFKDAQGNYVTGTRALYTAILCIITYAVMMLLPYFTAIIPSTFVAIVIGTAIEYIFKLDTVTIGDLYELHGSFPKPQIPNIDWGNSSVISDVMVTAVLTAVISCIESFMSGYKIQQLTETQTNFERESLALGAAHIVNGFFQGVAGCVVFGPCILNIECGAGTRRLSSFICAVLMAIIPLALYSAISIIPMGALSAVVFGLSSKTGDWRMLAMIFLQRISFQESVVAILVTVMTVVEDLAIGAACGFAAALVFFMWNMSRGRVSMVPVPSAVPFATHIEETNFAVRSVVATVTKKSRSRRPSQLATLHSFPDEQSGQVSSLTKRPVSFTANATVDPVGPLPLSGNEDPLFTERSGGSSFAVPAVIPTAIVPPAESVAVSLGDVQVEACFPSTAPSAKTTLLSRRDRPLGGGAQRGREATAHNQGDADNLSGEDEDDEVNSLNSSTGHNGVGNDSAVAPHNRSIVSTRYVMDVNLLDVERDREFPEIKVLRIKLKGVLFFGSCMDFVDGMMKMLHQYHAEIFLKVTDLVLDFQHGLMPVMDFSAAEAIQDVARILAKRGIHCHVQNMDPLSYTCFDRCRRYFPDVSEDDVNNTKQFCFARRIFRVVSTHEYSNEVNPSGGPLDDDVFLRHNRSFAPASMLQTSAVSAPGNEVPVHHIDETMEPGHGEEEEQEGQEAVTTQVVVPLSSTEEQISLVDSIHVGFNVYRPQFGITTTVFDTVTNWESRLHEAQQHHIPSVLDVGLTTKKPFDRQFGDVGQLWLDRLLGRDIPKPAPNRDPNAALPPPSGPRNAPIQRRPAPTEFVQIARFPGQGFSRGERLHHSEWLEVKANVLRRLFHAEPGKESSRFVARMKKFEVDLVDGFI